MATEAKKTTPKAPQDRKAKAVKFDVTTTPGWELMKPFTDIPVWDQTPLIELVYSASAESDKEDGETFSVGIVGDIARALLAFAIDPDEYTKFVSGPGALERAMTLAMAWVGQMGESKGSETS